MSDKSAPPSPSKSSDSGPKVSGSVSELALDLEQRAIVISETSSSEISLQSPNVQLGPSTSQTASSATAPINSDEQLVANVASETSRSEIVLQSPNGQQLETSTSQNAPSDVAPIESDEQSERRRALLQAIANEPSIRPIEKKSEASSESKSASGDEEPTEPESPSQVTSSESVHSYNSWRHRRYEQRWARQDVVLRYHGPRRQFSPTYSSDSIDEEDRGESVRYGRRKRFLLRIDETRVRRENFRNRALLRRALSEPPLSDTQREDQGVVSSESFESLARDIIALWDRRQPRVEWSSYTRTLASAQQHLERRFSAPADPLELTLITSELFQSPYVENQPSTSSQPSVDYASERRGGIVLPPYTGNQPSSSSAPPQPFVDYASERRGGIVLPPYMDNQPSSSSAPPRPSVDHLYERRGGIVLPPYTGNQPSSSSAPPQPSVDYASERRGGIVLPPYMDNQPSSSSAPPRSSVERERLQTPSLENQLSASSVIPSQSASEEPVPEFSEIVFGNQSPSSITTRSVSSTGSVAVGVGVEINSEADITADLEDDWSIRTRSTTGGTYPESRPVTEVHVEYNVVMPPPQQSPDYDASGSDDDTQPPSAKRRKE